MNKRIEVSTATTTASDGRLEAMTAEMHERVGGSEAVLERRLQHLGETGLVHGRAFVASQLSFGIVLLEAKEICERLRGGDAEVDGVRFAEWISRYFDFSPRSADRYIAVARAFRGMEDKVGSLSLNLMVELTRLDADVLANFISASKGPVSKEDARAIVERHVRKPALTIEPDEVSSLLDAASNNHQEISDLTKQLLQAQTANGRLQSDLASEKRRADQSANDLEALSAEIAAKPVLVPTPKRDGALESAKNEIKRAESELARLNLQIADVTSLKISVVDVEKLSAAYMLATSAATVQQILEGLPNSARKRIQVVFQGIAKHGTALATLASAQEA